jgi:hypothetical protein
LQKRSGTVSDYTNEYVNVFDSTAPIIEGEVVTETAAMTPAPAHTESSSGTVLFTESEGIKTLLSYGVPLRLRVEREEQVLRLTVIPTLPPEQSSTAEVPAAPAIAPYETF